MIHYREKIMQLIRETSTQRLLMGFLIMGLITLGISRSNAQKESAPESREMASADTVVPAGHVLIPIEIQNIESLSSLVGAYAIVDLFTPQRGKDVPAARVGRRMKLLRAPLNPNLFAVLVTEAEAAEVLKTEGPFVVAIQNPDSVEASKMEKRKNKTVSAQVHYFRGAK